MVSAESVLDFWFKEIDPSLWFQKDQDFDRQIHTRFAETYEAVLKGETSSWRKTPEGRLAEIIVLDQFPRNMFRDTPRAFEGDALALKLAQEAVEAGADLKLPVQRRSFMYMPYMHSEDRKVHEVAVKLFSQKGLEYGLKYELMHKKIIDKFGRYPHRNKVLGRTSTYEELQFLQEENSSF